MSDWIWALIFGFVLDLLLGDPAWLYHPVCLIGKYISWMEKKLRRRGGNLRKSAVFLTASTVLLTMAVVALILMLCGLLGRIPLLIAMALLDWMGIAITSMAKEARGVEKALGQGVAAGRTQVARIVGRDTQDLSEEEIIKATVETVSENTTDGVISPCCTLPSAGQSSCGDSKPPARWIRWLDTWTRNTATLAGRAQG